jgi:hypothetical protein
MSAFRKKSEGGLKANVFLYVPPCAGERNKEIWKMSLFGASFNLHFCIYPISWGRYILELGEEGGSVEALHACASRSGITAGVCSLEATECSLILMVHERLHARTPVGGIRCDKNAKEDLSSSCFSSSYSTSSSSDCEIKHRWAVAFAIAAPVRQIYFMCEWLWNQWIQCNILS